MGVYGDSARRHDEPLDAAFERFVVRASPVLLRAAVLLTGERATAEDLVQMTLLRVYRRWDSISSSPDAYARQALVNLSRDRTRALRRRPLEVELSHGTGIPANEQLTELLERDAITRAVCELPRRLREVVVLRFFLDLSVAQTASALGTSEGAVKASAARAVTRLRTLLEADASAHEARSEVSDAH